MLDIFCVPDSMNGQSYSSFGLALEGCKKNNKCVGIFEENCDVTGEFKLCEEINDISNGVTPNSCIYMKGDDRII